MFWSIARMAESMELACTQCNFTSVCGPAAMVDWLSRVRMIRRDVAPAPELLGELFRAAASKYTCPECGVVGLTVREASEYDDEAWGGTRKCAECGRPIPR